MPGAQCTRTNSERIECENPDKVLLHPFRNQRKPLNPAWVLVSNEGALAKLDDEYALERIASGTLSKVIAGEYGVTPYAVRKRLAKHPDYPQAIKDQAESFVESAMEYVMSCDLNTVAIARARVDAAFKWAAARDPKHWSNKIDITSGDKPLSLADPALIVMETARALAFIFDRAGGAMVIEGADLSTDCTAIAAPQHDNNNQDNAE